MSRAKETRNENMPSAPPHLELASEALLEGWTRQQVIAALVSRIRRDEGYLAYRKATGRRTNYDDQVKADMRALALAACWLEEATATVRLPKAPAASERPKTAGS